MNTWNTRVDYKQESMKTKWPRDKVRSAGNSRACDCHNSTNELHQPSENSAEEPRRGNSRTSTSTFSIRSSVPFLLDLFCIGSSGEGKQRRHCVLLRFMTQKLVPVSFVIVSHPLSLQSKKNQFASKPR